MIKYRWEIIHGWWLEDVRFELEQMWEVKKMLRKHPDDAIGNILREVFVSIKKSLVRVCKQYEKVYGCRPPVRAIRGEVEG